MLLNRWRGFLFGGQQLSLAGQLAGIGSRFLVLRRLSELGLIVQLDDSASALFLGVDDASVEGAGINVQADRPLVEFARIVDAVDGFEGINRTGPEAIH